MSPRRLSDPVQHPDLQDVSILAVMHALSDRTRIGIVRELITAEELACGTFHVDVSPSTLSHHFKVLRESGIIYQREAGRHRLTTLRLDELEQRFPGLVDTILAQYADELKAEQARQR